MIQEIKIKNFRSFKDEVVFSFLASDDKFAEDSQVVKIDENTRLLRFAIIYGYNASGKTNLIDALRFLAGFLYYNPKDIDAGTDVTPFKLDKISSTNPTQFELTFYVEKTKYFYQLELDEDKVFFEKLSYFNLSEQIVLFERRLENNLSVIDFTDNEEWNNVGETVKEQITGNCLKNISFFVARRQVNVNLPKIDAAKDWLMQHILPPIYPSTRLTHYAEKKLSENNKLSDYIVEFLSGADSNVTGIKSDVLENSSLPQTIFEHTVENENGIEKYYLDKNEQSRGTLRIFGLETVVNEIITTNSFLAVDEIETSLHNKLLEKMLFEFLNADSNSQLLVTTHNDSLFDLLDDLIRKDSVYFMEKNKAGVTDLYKLTDFNGIDELPSIRSAYRYKRFGATMK